MKHGSVFPALLFAIGLTILAGAAGAQDTSPYLMGTFQDSSVISITWYHIVNPTTKPLDVYAMLYFNGSPFVCSIIMVPANGATNGCVFGDLTPPGAHTVKFFAFPYLSRKFDPNAVIGGFQRITMTADPAADPNPYLFNTETGMKAITINSSTIGEFAQIPWQMCQRFR
jgi:hypothetical protein